MLMTPDRAGGVSIGEVDIGTVSDSQVTEWIRYDALMNAESPPSPLEFSRLRITNVPIHLLLRVFVAWDPDHSVIGEARAIFPNTDVNQHICQLHLSVRPDRRRRRIASDLLGLVTMAANQQQRTLLIGWTSGSVPAGEEFARRMGAKAAQRMHVHTLPLSELNHDKLQKLTEKPVGCEDYSMAWLDGPYSEELIQAVTGLRQVLGTAPRGGLELEFPTLTAAQVKSADQTMVASGVQRWSLFARHDPTATLAGFTEMEYHPAQSELVRQAGTAVQPLHRGRGLGKWLKAVMLARVIRERQQVKEIRTGTADCNWPMIAINRELGFKLAFEVTGWQAGLERIREHLG